MIRASMAGISAVMFWSMNVLMAKILAGHLSPVLITFCRWFVAALVLLPFIWKHMAEIKYMQRHDWLFVIMQACCGIILCGAFVYQAGYSARAIDMALLGATAPIFMAVFSSVLLHTTITLRQFVGYSFALVGTWIILLHDNLNNLEHLHFVIGDVWMLGAAICFALYSTAMVFKSPRLSDALYLELTMVVGCVLMAPFAAWHMMEDGLSGLTLSHGFTLVYMGICQSALAFLAWTYCLSSLGSARAGLIYYTKPLFTIIGAYFLLGESMQMSQLLGGCLVLGGVVYAAIENKNTVRGVAHS